MTIKGKRERERKRCGDEELLSKKIKSKIN
jgi:hypothetical protein